RRRLMLDANARRRAIHVLPQHDRLIVLVGQAAVEAVTVGEVVVVRRRGERRPRVAAAAGVAWKVRRAGDVADVGADRDRLGPRDRKIHAAAVVHAAAARFGALVVEEIAARVVVEQTRRARHGDIRLLMAAGAEDVALLADARGDRIAAGADEERIEVDRLDGAGR